MAKAYTKEQLLEILEQFEVEHNRLPTKREIRGMGMDESPFYRVFGGLTAAKEVYQSSKRGYEQEELSPTQQHTLKDSYIDILKSNLSIDELKTLVASSGVSAPRTPKICTELPESGYFKFIATGDSHMGHNEFKEEWWYSMIRRGEREKIDWMYHTGDILEGMSNRPGHIYELSHIGFESQFGYAKQLIGDCQFPVKAIIGNHDEWYCGKADQGVNVGNRLEESLDNFIFLGNQEFDEYIGNIVVKLWHGNDGSSYALSYRTQKFIEQLYGGDKPHILLAGHAHKSIFYQTRNVQVIETGTTCKQTRFMRGKKLAAHTGYWIVECWANENGLARIRPEWVSFY